LRGRLRTDARTKAYVEKRINQRHSKLEAIRYLKRYITREIFYIIQRRQREINSTKSTTLHLEGRLQQPVRKRPDQALLAELGFVCSMSRKGNCWDNAVAERFFLNLKMERAWQRNYASHAEAKHDVANYIAGFYNCERLHSVLGNMPPSVYERTMAEEEPIVVPEIT
jgi:putative transposase